LEKGGNRTKIAEKKAVTKPKATRRSIKEGGKLGSQEGIWGWGGGGVWGTIKKRIQNKQSTKIP